MDQTARVQIISDNAQACRQRGCELVLLRQRVLRDRRSGRCLLQLRLQNQTGKAVRALILRLDCLDAAGKSLAKQPACAMTKLHADAGACFGADRLVLLRSRLTQSVCVTVLRILFADGSDWCCRESTACFVPIRQAASAPALAGARQEAAGQMPQQRTLPTLSARAGTPAPPAQEAAQFEAWLAELKAWLGQQTPPACVPAAGQPKPLRKRRGRRHLFSKT